MKISFVTQWCRRLASVGATALMLAALGVMPAHALVGTGSFLELDGNVADSNSAANLPDDWSNFGVVPPCAVGDINCKKGTSNTTRATGIVTDGTPSVFRGSKDTRDISTWRYDLGSSPPKDDLLHAYAAAYTATASTPNASPGNLMIYFGANRPTDSGTASLGFWFFKNQVALDNANGRFIDPSTNAPATHANGDVLVAFDYSNGGAVTGVRVFRWSNGALTGGDLVAGLAPTTDATVFCDGNKNVCGTNNYQDITLPWIGGAIKPGQFFEGGINLSRIFNSSDTCFASFMATTRTSTVANATIKNFILGDFPVCRLTVTKSCESSVFQAATNNVLNTVVGQVLNDGGGTLTNISLVDNPVFTTGPTFHTCDAAGLPTGAGTATAPSSLAAGASICYRASQTSITSSTGDTVTASALAGQSPITGTAHTTCVVEPPPTGLSVTKTCDVVLDGTSGQLKLLVNYGGSVTNTSGAALSNVVVCEAHEQTLKAGQSACDVDVPHITHTIGTLAAAGLPGSSQTYAGSYYPSKALDGGGLSTLLDPEKAVFKDVASAQGNLPTILGGGLVKTALPTEAVCPLCQ